MQTGKVNQRILSFMEKRGMDVTALCELASEDSLVVASVSRCYPRMAVSTRVVMIAWYSLSRTIKKSGTEK